MACFITPLVTGLILEVIRRVWRNSWRVKLDLLVKMLLTGSLLLVIEHIWHGEIVPYPPFLTAMKNPSDIPIMINEVTTIGGSMTLLVVATWGFITILSRRIVVKVETPIRVTTTLK